MRKSLLILVFFGLVLSSLSAWSGFIEIVNRTGFTIYWIYVSHEDERDWNKDRLGREVLLDGDGFTVYLDDYPSPYFDIRVIDEDNDSYTFNRMNLDEVSVLEVVLDQLDRRR